MSGVAKIYARKNCAVIGILAPGGWSALWRPPFPSWPVVAVFLPEALCPPLAVVTRRGPRFRGLVSRQVGVRPFLLERTEDPWSRAALVYPVRSEASGASVAGSHFRPLLLPCESKNAGFAVIRTKGMSLV